MEIKQLEALTLMAKYKTYSKAAVEMGVTLPTVGAQIAALETELGCELLQKVGKELTPTPQGLLVLKYAADILAKRDACIAALGDPGMLYSGNLVLSASSAPSARYVSGVMAAFHRRYPSVTYQVHNTNSLQVIDEVRRGAADVGFTGVRRGDCNCVFHPIATEELTLITASTPEFSGLPREAFPLDMLKAQPFIVREPGSGTRLVAEERLAELGVQPSELNVVAEMSHLGSIVESVAAGLGVAILPSAAVREGREAGRLLCFGLDGGPIKRELFIVIRQNRAKVSLANMLVEFALDYFD